MRINKDGTVPNDNPFYNQASGVYRSIWAMGLRNPFTFAFNRAGTRMYINDVGSHEYPVGWVPYEEINEGIAGSNYGWPVTEGDKPASVSIGTYRRPLHAYAHTGDRTSSGCAVAGGAFYTPQNAQFPAEYVGDYFFADYCNGWIRRYDPDTNQTFAFGTGLPFGIVDVRVSNDGSLYYLARQSGATGSVYRIQWGAALPQITQPPSSLTVTVGGRASFSCGASGSLPLTYRWTRNGVVIAGATASTYVIPAVGLRANGAAFRCIVRNRFGSATSSPATLTVTTDRPPEITTFTPLPGSRYSAGETIQYAATATDPEDGVLPASAFTWRIELHHDQHTHPVLLPTSGMTGGSFVPAREGHTETNVWYRITLTVRDSDGMTTTVARNVRPRIVTLTLNSNVPGTRALLNSQPVTLPATFDSVVGVRHTFAIGALWQRVSGGMWAFRTWSTGANASQTIDTPAVDTTYTARWTNTASVHARNTDSTPTLTWNVITWARRYQVQIASRPTFAQGTVVYNVRVDRSVLSVTPPNPLPEGRYFWRARAERPDGTWGAWSAVETFTIDTP